MSTPEHSGMMNNSLAGSGRNSHVFNFCFYVVRLATYQTSLFLRCRWFRIVPIWNVHPGTFRVDGQWLSRFRKELSCDQISVWMLYGLRHTKHHYFSNVADLEFCHFGMSIPEHSGLMDNGLAESGRNSRVIKFPFFMLFQFEGTHWMRSLTIAHAHLLAEDSEREQWTVEYHWAWVCVWECEQYACFSTSTTNE